MYMMLFKYIDFRVFLASFIFGMFCIYISGNDLKVVFVYPQPDKSVQYKDKAGQCFEYSATETKCPSIPFMTNTIPIQE
jgi:hypothetical protein